MSKKISDFFKIEPRFNQDCDSRTLETSTTNEEKFDTNLEGIRNCRVILQDISKEVKNGKFKNLTIHKSESNLCQSRGTENCIKSSPKTHNKTSKPIQCECKFCNKMFPKSYIFQSSIKMNTKFAIKNV